MNIADQVSTDLLDTLGVPWQGQHITGVTLRIRSQKLPVVVVHRHLGPEPFSEQVSQRFCLVPVTDALAPFTNQPNPGIKK